MYRIVHDIVMASAFACLVMEEMLVSATDDLECAYSYNCSWGECQILRNVEYCRFRASAISSFIKLPNSLQCSPTGGVLVYADEVNCTEISTILDYYLSDNSFYCSCTNTDMNSEICHEYPVCISDTGVCPCFLSSHFSCTKLTYHEKTAVVLPSSKCSAVSQQLSMITNAPTSVPTLPSSECIEQVSYKTATGGCAPVKSCNSSAYEVAPATVTTDRRCAERLPPSACKNRSSYVSALPTSTTNTVCSPCTICARYEQQCCSGRDTCNNAKCFNPENPYLSSSSELSMVDTVMIAVGIIIFMLGMVYWIGKIFCRKDTFDFEQDPESSEELLDTQTFNDNALREMLIEPSMAAATMRQAWQIPQHHIEWTELIAAGANGTVYRGKWAGHSVAVKVLKNSLFDDPSQRLDFDRECQTLMTVKHRNLLIFFGAGLDDQNRPFLVTEFMSNGSLRNLLDTDSTLRFEIRAKITRQIACGCAHLHKLGIVHRDLKSDNVLLDQKMDAKVGDFGNAKLMMREIVPLQNVASQAGLTSSDHAMTKGVGTTLWMAPEMFTVGHNYGPEVDIYSFGVIMWEILTRRWPWDELDDSSHLAFASALHEALLAERRPEITEEAKSQASPIYLSMMDKCWATDPSSRPTFSTVFEALSADRMFLVVMDTRC